MKYLVSLLEKSWTNAALPPNENAPQRESILELEARTIRKRSRHKMPIGIAVASPPTTNPPNISPNRTDPGAKAPATTELKLPTRHKYPPECSQSSGVRTHRTGLASATVSATHPKSDSPILHPQRSPLRRKSPKAVHAIPGSPRAAKTKTKNAMSCKIIGVRLPQREEIIREAITEKPTPHSHRGHDRAELAPRSSPASFFMLSNPAAPLRQLSASQPPRQSESSRPPSCSMQTERFPVLDQDRHQSLPSAQAQQQPPLT
jgi:hypothetical protein